MEYPFAKYEHGVEFMSEVRRKEILTEEEFEMIAYETQQDCLKSKNSKFEGLVFCFH